MTRQRLEQLATIIEALQGPADDVNRAILAVLGFEYRERKYSIGLTYAKDWDRYTAKEWVRGEEVINANSIPRFTASLDAAMTLAPEGIELAIYTNFVLTRGFPQQEGGGWIITDEMPRGCWVRVYGGGQFKNVEGQGMTPALAITAAALRARAASMKE